MKTYYAFVKTEREKHINTKIRNYILSLNNLYF